MSVKILRKVGQALVEVFTVDVTIAHSIRLPNTITEHPVEGGGTITDNVRNDPLELTMTGFISNYPTRIGLTLIPRRDDTRGRTAMEALLVLRRNKEIVQIQDELQVYNNMMLGNVDIPRDSQTHNGFQFTATFRQVELVGVQVAELEDTDEVKDTATPAADLGKTTAEDSKPEVAQRASIAYQLIIGD